MKSKISKSTVTLAAAAAVACTSCATTGNPREGGIFWSEAKAKDRLNERQGNLENIERQTDSTNRKSQATKRKIDSM